jgi:hypothetical protein
MDVTSWFIDHIANEDIIDLYFIVSDLVDIVQTDAELAETAHCDAMCTAAVAEHEEDGSTRRVPLGKLVF